MKLTDLEIESLERKPNRLTIGGLPDGCGFCFSKTPPPSETGEQSNLEQLLRMGSFNYYGLIEEIGQQNKRTNMKLKAKPEKLTKSQKSTMEARGKKMHAQIQEQHTLDLLQRENCSMESQGRFLEVFALTQCEVDDCGSVSTRTKEKLAKLHSMVGRKVVGVMVDKESTLRSGTLYKLHLIFE